MTRIVANLLLILLGLALIVLAFYTILSTGPFIFVTVLPGFFVLWRGLHRVVGPPWAFFIALCVVVLGFVAPAFV